MTTKINLNQTERLTSVIGGSALISFGLARRSWPLSALSIAAGVPLLLRGWSGHSAVYEVTGLNTADHPLPAPLRSTQPGVPEGKGISVEHEIAIDKPVSEVFRFWSNFENLPRFMNHLESVKLHQNGSSHWVAKAPLGMKVEWDAEIVDAKPNEFIVWRSKPGTSVPNEGIVHFAPSEDGESTVVRVKLDYRPPAGALGATIAKIFGEEPQRQVVDDLERFKCLLETGEVTDPKGQNSARKEEVEAAARPPAPNSEHHTDEPIAEYKQQLKQEAKTNKAETLEHEDAASDMSFPASDPPAY